MLTESSRPSPAGALLLCLLLTVFALWWLQSPPVAATVPPPPPGDLILRTTPPPEVGIELTDAELLELESAYTSGFDHPDPGSNDPCERLRLLPYKKLSAWRRQFRRRGFTMGKVKELLRGGRREMYVDPEKGTRYTKIYDAAGNWIVVDFVDCLIWQVAPYNFK